MGETKPILSTTTKLNRIAQLSSEHPDMEFNYLMPHINKESHTDCYHRLDGKKAVGIDGVTKEAYGANLEGNIEALLDRMKRMAYRPQTVREVRIPKVGKPGATRPLCISAFEDKLVQFQIARILESIYEPLFRESSYGFRPKRSCHTAVKALFTYLSKQRNETVIDIDLENFFGRIEHHILIEFLRRKIKDERLIRYVARMLKSGILSEGQFRVNTEGSAQGNIASPILSNIYAHYVIDEWLEDTVPRHTSGAVKSFRYADDLVICCQDKRVAEKIQRSLKKRLNKYGLEMNQEKTKTVKFNQRAYPKIKQGQFDYLGFTFYVKCVFLSIVNTYCRIVNTHYRFIVNTYWCFIVNTFG